MKNVGNVYIGESPQGFFSITRRENVVRVMFRDVSNKETFLVTVRGEGLVKSFLTALNEIRIDSDEEMWAAAALRIPITTDVAVRRWGTDALARMQEVAEEQSP